ncbi:MAG TPA: PLP-dependent aminotransferase family protein [Limnochordia bacterium]
MPPESEVKTDRPFAARMRGASGNAIREILKLTQQSGVISFAGGMPSPSSFPTAALERLASRILHEEGPRVLQYGITEGDPELRAIVADKLLVRGIRASADDILILTGSQQGIDLLFKALIDPGDLVVVERPTYLAVLQIARAYEAEVVSIPIDEMGIRLDALEALLAKRRPKILYTVPTFQNPSGVSLAADRRRRLAQLAAEHGFVVIEDDPYADLRFEGEPVPAIKASDAAPGHVVYLGSFSKIISPGLRVGYAVAPPDLYRAMAVGKQGTDVHTSNLSQRLIAAFCRSGELEPHIARIAAECRQKRDRMLAALDEHMPAGSTWTRPGGGLFVWVTLPEGLHATALLAAAVEKSVAFVPGEPFFAPDALGEPALAALASRTLRLNFSNATVDDIDTGIARLGAVFRSFARP